MLFNNIAARIGFLFVYLYNHYQTQSFVHVGIDKGILRGRQAITWHGKIYFSFKGIPYAKPPINELRFKGPQEETAWAGVRDAVFHGDVCPQIDMAFGIFRGQEDCLYLNVYTPSMADERRAVMVWIHGGMFMLGSGNDELYGPDYLVDSGVVLVTMNYRLGPLGFLSTEDDGAPGNAGMKDQVAALRWVQRNIAKFGGDPDNVTIFGGSSGAICAHLHLLSPMSTGLFTKVISQSGSALNAWGLANNSAQVTIRLAEALGAKDLAGNTLMALEFLKTIPYKDIVMVQGSLLNAAEESVRIPFLFIPSVERGVTSEEIFLPDLPLKMIESGNFTKVPIIFGYNTHEGYFFNNELEEPEIRKAGIEDTKRYVPSDITNERVRNSLAKSIRKFYFDDKPIGNENITNFVNLYSDATFVVGVKRAAKLHVQSTNTPTYFYSFSHDDKLNVVKFFANVNRPGAVHGDELGYLFHQRLLFWKTPANGSRTEYVVNTMVRLWTNFAKYGNPTPPGDPLNWKPLTVDEFNYLNISGEAMQVAQNPDPDRTIFWERAYEKSYALRTGFCRRNSSCQYESHSMRR